MNTGVEGGETAIKLARWGRLAWVHGRWPLMVGHYLTH